MSDQDLLTRLDDLPDLLKMAWETKETPADDVYVIQERLQEEYRQKGIPFHWSMPYRHLAICPICGTLGADISHELEDPRSQGGQSQPVRVGFGKRIFMPCATMMCHSALNCALFWSAWLDPLGMTAIQQRACFTNHSGILNKNMRSPN
ncbi:MAG: hypothetical protein HPY76_12380 [Anaerolineae bacterium]|nr:hypothetical protein [Anaerolineae bacterium]